MSNVPDIPHMSKEAIKYLSDKFKHSETFLEYGAGGSTVLAAETGVNYIYSVESDPIFAESVRDKVSINADSKLKMIVPDIGPVGEWGYPRDYSQCHKWHNYPLYVWEVIHKNNRFPDLILIDGRFRVSCFLISIINSPAGTPIVFDDYVSRFTRYGLIEKIIRPIDFMGDSAIFHVPNNLNREQCYLLLAKNIVNKY